MLRTCDFLFYDGAYFVLPTDNLGVRIGAVGGICFDLPGWHALADRVRDAVTRKEVEALYDELSAWLYKGKE